MWCDIAGWYIVLGSPVKYGGFCYAYAYCFYGWFLCPHCFVFSALTLFIGRQEEHPVCKKIDWWGAGMVMSGARCKWFAYGPADYTVTPSSLASLKSGLVWPFWCWLTQVVLEKRLLNKCLLQINSIPREVASGKWQLHELWSLLHVSVTASCCCLHCFWARRLSSVLL